MIRIPTAVKNEMIRHCEDHYPNEACGLLSGAIQTNGNINVWRFQPIANVAEQPGSRFQMDPYAWIDALYGAERNKEPIVGIVHSHPNCDAVPSNEDLQTVWHTLPSYWIVSLSDRHIPVIKAYKMKTINADEQYKIRSSLMYEEILIVNAND